MLLINLIQVNFGNNGHSTEVVYDNFSWNDITQTNLQTIWNSVRL